MIEFLVDTELEARWNEEFGHVLKHAYPPGISLERLKNILVFFFVSIYKYLKNSSWKNISERLQVISCNEFSNYFQGNGRTLFYAANIRTVALD
jgi:hypothetical protein